MLTLRSLEKETAHKVSASVKRTIGLQAAAIAALEELITPDLHSVVQAILDSPGRLVISGVGKSAIVAQKITATLNSTGTPALFMHAADAIHGDLGMIRGHDLVMIISKSGDSPEIKILIPLVKNFGNRVIGMTGNRSSYLAKESDWVIDTTVSAEACPNGLAPTTSTTAQIVMGDALAISLMELRGFEAKDFAKYHPGGMLGKKLYLRAADLIKEREIPKVNAKDSVKSTIVEISRKRLGAVGVVDDKNELIGVITDGDVRRMFEKYDDFSSLQAQDIMSGNPKSIDGSVLAVEALDVLRDNNISQLIVTDAGQFQGILHIHDLIKEGFI